MPNFNRVILMGNLTRDPELRYIPGSGQAVADLSLAISRRTRTQEGEWRDSATYVDITACGRQAEAIHKYFTRGRPILVEGYLQLDRWISKKKTEKHPDGEPRSKLRVVLERFEFITSRDSEARPAAGGGSRPAPRGQSQSQDHADAPPPSDDDDDFGPEALDDDVPF